MFCNVFTHLLSLENVNLGCSPYERITYDDDDDDDDDDDEEEEEEDDDDDDGGGGGLST